MVQKSRRGAAARHLAVDLVEQGVFVQVMEQYGRVLEPQRVDEYGNVIELDPAAASTTAAAAALDGLKLMGNADGAGP